MIVKQPSSDGRGKKKKRNCKKVHMFKGMCVRTIAAGKSTGPILGKSVECGVILNCRLDLSVAVAAASL